MIHSILGYAAIIMMIIAAVNALKYLMWEVKPSGDSVIDAHILMGLVTTFVAIIMMVLGMATIIVRKFKNPKWNTKLITRIRFIHVSFAYIIIFVALIVWFLGNIIRNPVSYTTILLAAWLIVLGLCEAWHQIGMLRMLTVTFKVPED